MRDYFILAMLWILYCTVHSLFASNRIKDLFRDHAGNWYRFYRIAYSIFSVVLLLPVIWFQFSMMNKLLFEPNVFAILGGLALITGGIMVLIISFRHYDLHEFIGIRQIQGITNGQSMQDEGMLSLVRHPLYSGSILAVVGYFLFLPYLASLVMGIILILYFLLGIHLEEKKLVVEFGDEYKRYKQEVPPLIPSWKKVMRHYRKAKKK
jgi:protein-S-isoprenylcysteine O-methyltransferase Ste14